MSEQRESFVFYRSFAENLHRVPPSDRLTAYECLIACALGDRTVDSLPYPLNAIIGQMLKNVDAAKKRYDSAVENGKKGGRPRKWIDQEEAEALYTELGSWPKVADALDVDRSTLWKARKAWEYAVEKPKNLNVTVNDTVNDNDTVSINNKKENAPAARAQSASPRREPTREESIEVCKRLRDSFFEMTGRDEGGEQKPNS